MPVSRPAVSQHLAVLKEAGLVVDRPVGTRRVYYIDPRGLSALRAWFDQFWDQALASFQDEVQRTIAARRPTRKHVTATVTIAPVRKSVVVDVDCGARLRGVHRRLRSLVAEEGSGRPGPPGRLPAVKESVIEPFAGGRWYSRCEDGLEVDLGHVLAWEPGRRLLLTWDFDAHWQPDPSAALRGRGHFIAEGRDATRVELEHRHFERMGKDGGEKMRRDVEGGWPARLEIYARVAAGQSS